MDSNPINEALRSGRIETTEDVEGHKVARADGPDTDDTDDTEGHGTVRGGLVEDDQDVEGHGATSKHIDGPDTDDTEGHATRVKV